MTNRFTGIGGDDAKDGLSWENRKATILGMLTGDPGARPAPGDRLYVGPGVYREGVVFNRNGASVTTSGTVSVTEGSKVVTGSGTNWDPAVHEGDQISIPWLASGTDGVGTAGAGFSSATAAFENTIQGFSIDIQGEGSYLIDTVTPPNDITLIDVNGVGWPANAGGMSFWVPSNEGSYEIESVDSDTQITLKRPWSGPTYTGRSYRIWRPVYLIGDETGAFTDGIGGICRITGSDNDQTATRNYGVRSQGLSYWVMRGFQLDSFTVRNFFIEDPSHHTFEDIRSLCSANDAAERHFYLFGETDGFTLRRCALFGGNQAYGVEIAHGGTMQWGRHIHLENIRADVYRPFRVVRHASVTIKNCVCGMHCDTFLSTATISAGGSVFIHDCEIHYCATDGLNANVLGQIVANLNNYWGNLSDWTNVDELGGQNYEYMYIPDTPMLLDGYRYPVRLFPPSEWWAPKALLGLYGANQDMSGVSRPGTKSKRSYGPQQDQYIVRNTTITYGGEDSSLEHPDARITQFRIPISGVPVTVTVWVYLGAAFAGTAKLVVYQPGNTDVEATATGTTGTWEQLSVEYVPNEQPLYLWAELVSDNTAGVCYWQRLLTEVTL